jgi:hypothetical protein
LSRSFHVNVSFSGLEVIEKVFEWPHSIFSFLWLSPLWRMVLYCNKHKFPSPKDDLFRVWLKYWPAGSEEDFQKSVYFYFTLLLSSSLEKGVALHLKNYFSPHPGGDILFLYFLYVRQYVTKSCAHFSDKDGWSKRLQTLYNASS